MSAKTTRILKEARSLFWPWCAVIIAGALRLVEQSDSALLRGGALQGIHPLVEAISFLGFFVGIPLLATLSLGNEFHYRTLQLLLSQPVSRMEIWSEKLIVTIVAVLAAALVFRYGQQSTFPQDPELWVVGGALIIAMISSATFWTLVARSTMGGLALNAVSCSIPLVWHLRRAGIGTRSAHASCVHSFDCGSSRDHVAGGRKNVGDAFLAPDPARAGSPPVAHQTGHSRVHRFGLCRSASHLAADGRQIHLRIDPHVREPGCGDDLAAWGAALELCLILVRLRG